MFHLYTPTTIQRSRKDYNTNRTIVMGGKCHIKLKDLFQCCAIFNCATSWDILCSSLSLKIETKPLTWMIMCPTNGRSTKAIVAKQKKKSFWRKNMTAVMTSVKMSNDCKKMLKATSLATWKTCRKINFWRSRGFKRSSWAEKNDS